jgi:hypothetical protein
MLSVCGKVICSVHTFLLSRQHKEQLRNLILQFLHSQPPSMAQEIVECSIELLNIASCMQSGLASCTKCGEYIFFQAVMDQEHMIN